MNYIYLKDESNTREEKNLKVEEVFIEGKKGTIFKKEYDQNDERNQFIQYAYEK